MSKRSKRRHRQQNQQRRTPHGAVVTQSNAHPNGWRGRITALLVVTSLVVLAAAALFAMKGGGGRKTESASGAITNSGPSAVRAPSQEGLAATPVTAPAAVISGPRISFATPIHDFGQIKGGDTVKYTYVFTNIGDRLLEVTNVQASCGCTTAGDWTRKVEPGQTGSIPIQFNSGSFTGQVGKSITVTCNDTNQPTVVLQIKGTIWRPIDVTPQFAVLNVNAESPSNSTTVRIVSNVQEPLTLSPPESSNPAFSAELQTNEAGKEFQLIVRTVPPLPTNNLSGQITLKTSSTNMPVVNVSTWANVQPVVTVSPSQITLPATPLTNPMPSTVSIRNNGTNNLTLSDATVNAKGVGVQLKEIEPGRFFTLNQNFPAQFDIAQSEAVELNVKSNHPKFPVIKVPIVRPVRPVPVAVPAPGQMTQPPVRAGAGG